MVSITTIALACLSLNIYHESRNQPVAGQVAVAMVTMNRADWKPEKVCNEVVKRKQFSWTESKIAFVKGRYKLRKSGIPQEKKAWARSVYLAKKVMNKRLIDTSKGATYFHTKQVKPYWAKSRKKTVVIGNHIFYKEKENS